MKYGKAICIAIPCLSKFVIQSVGMDIYLDNTCTFFVITLIIIVSTLSGGEHGYGVEGEWRDERRPTDAGEDVCSFKCLKVHIMNEVAESKWGPQRNIQDRQMIDSG